LVKTKRTAATPKGIERRLDDARFCKVKDPRRKASVKFPLATMLSALVAAVVTGARALRQLEQRTAQIVKKHGGWRGLRRRIADNTFSTLLPRLQLVQVLGCLHRMVKAEHRRGNLEPTHLPMGTVAIDGKHVATIHWHDLSRLLQAEEVKKGSAGRGGRLSPTADNIARLRALLAEQYPEAQLCVPEVGEPHVKMRVHTVTLVSSGPAVCIHQRPVPGHTNEIGAMPNLLDELRCVYGRTRLFRRITTDAGNTSQSVARLIVELGCDYFCQIKSPHGDIYAEATRTLSRRSKAQAHASYSDTQNGEVVTYHLWRIDLGEQGWLDWNHARQMVRIQRIAEHPGTGKRSVGNRYYMLSQSCDELGPQSALDVSRAHWRCENNTHWTADAELMEDQRRLAWSHHPSGVLVVAALRMMGLLILAVTRQLSRMGYSRERPSWSQVIQHYLLRLCDSTLETEAFDDV